MSENKEEQPKPPTKPADEASGPHEPGVGGDGVKPAAKPAISGPENPGGGGN